MSWVWHRPPRRASKPQWDKAQSDPFAVQAEYVYAWERRCRGYDVFQHPVPLEPSWIPFDSDVPHGFDPSSLYKQVLGGHPCAPFEFATFSLPAEQKVTPEMATSCLHSLPGSPASFEVIGSGDEVTYQIGVGLGGTSSFTTSQGKDALAAALAMHFPLAEIGVSESVEGDALRRALAPFRGQPVGYAVVDFGLLHLAYQPLQRWSRFSFDPLASLVNVLGQIGKGEVAGLQVLFAPARSPWGSGLHQMAAMFSDGEPIASRFSPQPGNPLIQASAKTESPLYFAAVRIFAVSRKGNAFRSNDQAAFDLCRRLGQCLSSLALEGGNALLALDNRDEDGTTYEDEDHFRDLLARCGRRHGMLLSLDELVGLVHPPHETLQHPKLLRPVAGEEPLPQHLLDTQGALLGLHPYRSQEQPLRWPDGFRNRHAYVLGATRSGKSTLLLNLIAQDLRAGQGLCLIDPHGDLAKDVLALVPPERAGDTCYLDFADREHPPAIGLLQAGDDWEARLLCSDLLSILRRLFASSWGDRLEHILRHVLLTLLADQNADAPHTLRDIRPLLSDKAYRQRVLASVHDHDLRAFWRDEFPGYSASTFSPIYNKLGLLLSSPIVRNIVTQGQSRLHLGRVIGGNQVLLVNLNQSLVGQDNAHFLGALLVSKLQIAAMQSLRHEREERSSFTLYVDEFQNFVVSSFEKLLSEAGKAGLSLVMANQFIEQLPPGLQSAIWGNVGTLVSFRVSSEGARLLEKELAGRFKQSELVSLNRGEAVARIGQARDSFFIRTLPPPTKEANQADCAAQVVQRTREQWCRPRQEVEDELAAFHQKVEGAGQDGRSESDGRMEAPPMEADAKMEGFTAVSDGSRAASKKSSKTTTKETTEPTSPRRLRSRSRTNAAADLVSSGNGYGDIDGSDDMADDRALGETDAPEIPAPPVEPECFGLPDDGLPAPSHLREEPLADNVGWTRAKTQLSD